MSEPEIGACEGENDFRCHVKNKNQEARQQRTA